MLIRRIQKYMAMLAIGLASGLCATTAQAGFAGNAVDADYRYSDIGTVFDAMSTQVVGAGVEWSLFGIAIDATDNTIQFSRPGGISFAAGSFNGWA